MWFFSSQQQSSLAALGKVYARFYSRIQEKPLRTLSVSDLINGLLGTASPRA